MKKLISTITILILVDAMLLGCNSTTVENPLLTSTSKPVPTEALLPQSSSLIPTPVCPTGDSKAEFILPESNDAIDDNVLFYLNAGGNPSEISSFFTQYQPTTLDVSVVDLTNDGLNEIVVAGTLPPHLNPSGNGIFHIFACENNAYRLEIEFIFSNMSSANIVRIEKLLADQPPQVIFYYQAVTGWASHILAIGSINGEYQIVFQDSEFSPKLVVFDQDNDGNKEISIHSINTATQGPHRELISTFKWDGKAYARISDQLMPGITRVEYLDDAQRALDQGDISMSIAYYERAAHDDTLHAYASRDELSNNQGKLAGNYQISFAFFRLAVLWLSSGDVETAKSVIDESAEQFSKNTPGHEFSEAASIFQEQIVQGATPQQACSEVTSFFTENYPDLNIHIGNWGVSVVDYSQLIELCPFR